MPAPHAEQDALPLALVRPCGQLVHVTASEAAAKVLPAQDVHAVWPSRLLARPGTHEKHTVWPVFVWNLPVAQVWHALAEAEFVYLPDGQLLHAFAAVSFWYFPGTHGRQ